MFWIFKKKYGGYIRTLGLTKFWDSLNEEEKNVCKDAFSKSFYPESFAQELVDGKNQKVKTELSASDFLLKVALKVISQKQYLLAEKALLHASEKEKIADKKHVILTELIDVYYKQRTEREDAIQKCIHFCQKDIQLASKISDREKDIPSFKRLAIILENEKKYDDAIKVSELALQYGLSDGTKGGYTGRIEKLKSKLV